MHRMDGHHYLRQQRYGHVEIAQLLMAKGTNIEATDEVQFVANVY